MVSAKKALEKSKKSVNAAVERIENVFGVSISAPNMRKLGIVSADMIKKRTRLGFGVPKDRAAKRKLLSLSYEYIEQRIEMADHGELSDATTPSKSNLTATGQMLDSLSLIAYGNSFAEISPVGRRYDSDKTNQEVSTYVEAAGRPYLNLSELEIKKLARFYQNNILKPALVKV